MRVAYPWVMAGIFGALVWGVPMTFLMQRAKVWTIGPHFAQHLEFWLVCGAVVGCFMRYVWMRRTRRNV
jgi:hypothetical protein